MEHLKFSVQGERHVVISISVFVAMGLVLALQLSKGDIGIRGLTGPAGAMAVWLPCASAETTWAAHRRNACVPS